MDLPTNKYVHKTWANSFHMGKLTKVFLLIAIYLQLHAPSVNKPGDSST